jgi:glycogen(starch) synthase
MRVLVISWEYPPIIEGGLARHVRKLSEHLVDEGVEVHVLTRGGGRLAATEERHGVVVHRLREPPFPKDVNAFVRWVETMNEDMRALGDELSDRFAFDVVHSHDWLVAGAAERIARRTGRPWLVTVHATEYGRHQGWVQNYPQSHIHAAERHMVRSADHVITCSRYMRSHVASVFGVRPSRITAMQNGIDPRDLEPVAPDLPKLRARYARADERLVLLVGRLVYEKGFHLALDALDRIADLCIVPSIYEPFGIVALEAMASGCLCVVADTGGLREVVPGDGTVGLRFPSRDTDALQEILERVLTDDAERAQLVAEARNHVLRFDWGEVARQTTAVYRELAQSRPAGVAPA